MDLNNFCSESNSIFVIQESSTNDDDDDEEDGIKSHDFEMCDEKSIIPMNNDDELKEIDDKMIINTHKSMNNSSVGVDHDYGGVTENVDISLNDHIIDSEDICESEDKTSSIADGVETFNTLGEDFICIKEEEHVSTFNESINCQNISSPSSTNLNQDTSEKVLSSVIPDQVQDNISSLSSPNLNQDTTEIVFSSVIPDHVQDDINSLSSTNLNHDTSEKVFSSVIPDRVQDNVSSLSSTNLYKDTTEKVLSSVISDKAEDNISSFSSTNLTEDSSKLVFPSDKVQDITDNLEKKIVSLVPEGTSALAKKHFKPICITGVKSLKITKNDMNIDKSIQSFDFEFHKGEDSSSSCNLYGKRRSEIWKYYSKLNLNETKCNLCFKKFLGSTNTSNLLRHLRSQHKHEVKFDGKLKCAFETETSSSNSFKMKKEYNFLSDKSTGKKISRIWKYFSKSKLGKVTCNICLKTLLYRQSNSALLRHLRFTHLYIYNKHIDNSFKNIRGYKSAKTSWNVSQNTNKLDPSFSNASIVFDQSSNDAKMCAVRRPSETWKYFTQITTDRIRCNICDSILKFVDGVSSNLTRHMRRRHYDIYSKFSPSVTKLSPSTCEPISERYQNDKKSFNKMHREQSSLMGSIGENVTKIRKYFTKFSSNKVRCIACYGLLPYTHGSTFNLKNHIIMKHKDIFERIVASVYNSCETFKTIADDGKKNEKVKLVWKYFTSMKSSKLKCNLCAVVPFYCDVSDSFQHLHLKHKISYNDVAEQSSKTTVEDETLEENKISVKNVNNAPAHSVKDFEESDIEKTNENMAADRTWKYFTKIYHDKSIEVKCNLCNDVFSYTHGVISNLIYHLNLVHKNSYSESDHGFLIPEQTSEDKEYENKFEKNGNDLITSTANKTGNFVSKLSKASKTWKYYTLVGPFKAQCNICLTVLSFQLRSNSNLTRHLKRRHNDVYGLINDSEPTSNKIEVHLNQSQCVADKENNIKMISSEMSRLYKYLEKDVKLKNLVVLDSGGLKCKICLKMFSCVDVNNYISILRQHMQINHAEWKIVCADDINSCKHDNLTSSIYNELEAIANEVESFKENKNLSTLDMSELTETSILDELNNSQNETYKNVWKYFTEITSTNVRCNFCSILLSYRSSKKWNLYRHLHLKHLSKLEKDDVEILKKIHGTNRPKLSPISPKKRKSNSGIKHKSPLKKNIHSDESFCKSDGSPDNLSNSSNLGKYWSVKPELFNRIGRTWSHFTKVDMGKAICNICHKTLRYLGNGSDVLNKHLSKNHLNKTLKSAKSKLSPISNTTNCDSSSDNYSDSKSNKPFSGKMKEPIQDKKLSSEEIENIILNDNGQKNDKTSSSESEDSDLDYIYGNSELSSEEEKQKKSKSGFNTFEKSRKSFIKKKLDRKERSSNINEKLHDEGIFQSRNNVWTYYTNLENGYARCHLCLSHVTYKGIVVNLIRHLQKIHAVLSLSNPTTESSDSNYEDKNGKSQLLAAIDLTPNKSKENRKQICYTKLNENTVKCNFCSHILSYKKNDIQELNCHLQNCSAIEDYNKLLLNNFTFFEDGDNLSRPILVNEVESNTYNQSTSSNNSADQNNVPDIKRGNTWLYYTKLIDDFAQCKICCNKLSFKNGSVYNLNRHLSVKHNIKLHRYKSFSKQKSYSKGIRMMPKIFKICNKKSGTLSFYSKVNRYVVKCKLCCKRFVYKGLNINRLINHLWSVHIARLIEFNSESIPAALEPMTDLDDEENRKNDSVSANTDCSSNVLKMINKSTADCIGKPESGRKFSYTWKYFTKNSEGDSKARCNICSKYFSYKNGNVSNLSRHLLRNHGIKLIKAVPRLKETETGARETEKKNTDMSIINEGPPVNTALTEICLKNFKTEKQGKPPSSVPFTDVCKKEYNESNSTPAKGNNDEIWKYFAKNSEDEVECITCNEKITLEEGNVSNLRNHLFTVHKIKVLSYVHPLSVVAGNDAMDIVKPFCNVNTEHVDNYCSIKTPNKKLKRYMSKLKCKLCYKYLVFAGNNSDKWMNHLSDHEKDLSLDENLFLLKLKNKEDTSFRESDTDIINGNKTSGYVGEMLVYKYFKNVKLFKRKCKICGKFISSKIHCSHRIPNDISVTYGINRNRCKAITASDKGDKLNKLIKSSLDIDEDNNNSQVSYKTRCLKSSCGVKNVIHFMNINMFENKCGLCCMSLMNKGYCSHSLNQWCIESQQTKSNDLKDHVKMEDELEIITDALSDGENKIIIITDDGASSVLNYEDGHKNHSAKEDVAYQVVNAEGENNDDIQVIIYNFNPEESGNSFDETSNNIKIGEIQDSGGTIQPCNKELEEQVKVILQELNNANSFTNQTKDTEILKYDKNLIDSEKLSGDQQIVLSAKNNNSFSSVETHQMPIKLNKTEVTCLDEAVSEIESEDLSNDKDSADYTLPSANTSDKSVQERPFSSMDQCSKTIVEPVNQPYEWLSKTDESIGEFTDVINAIDNNLKRMQQMEKNELNSVKINHGSMLRANEIEQNSEAVFDEANMNLVESVEQLNNFDSTVFVNDDFNIKSGVILQKLKSCMINKNLIYFSKINYKYKSAKCNLCSSYLFFKKPIIYNLLIHLYLRHENQIISFEAPLDITYDKNGKKVVYLDNYDGNGSDIKPRKRCPVWKFFINDSNCRATCKICRFNFSYKGGAVNNLGRHLRLRHNILVSTRNATDDYVDNYNEDVINYLKDYPTLPKRRSSVKLRSKTWNYFTKEPNDWAKCILCKKYLSYRSSTINNLRRHLRTVHANIYHSLFLENDNTSLKDDLSGQSEIMNDEVYKNILLDNATSRSRDEVLQECSYASSERSGTKRKSVVWNYFTEECRDSGRCNFCLKVISCKGGGTSNLSRHLRVKHGIWIVMTSTLSEKYEEEFNEGNEMDPTLNLRDDVSQSQVDTIITHEQLHILKKRKIMNRKSKTWDFFTKESSDRVVCKICSKSLSYKCKAVHNLRRHLAIKHPNHILKRDPPRIKLQISNEDGSIDSEGQNPSVDTDKTYIDITDTSVVIVDEENAPPVRKGDRVQRPKKSYAWNYFDEIEYGIAKCTMCGKILSFRGGGTNNLMRHLRSRHSMFTDVQLGDNASFMTADEVVQMAETENLDGENNFVLVNENSL